MFDHLDFLLSHSRRDGDIVWKRAMESILDQFGVQNLVGRSPISGNIGERVGDELDEPVLGDDESKSGPQQEDSASHNAKGGHDPQIGDLDVVLGDHVLYGLNLGQTAQKERGENKVKDDNLDLVLGVESEHGLFLFVARGLKNVVARLTQDQRGDTEVHRLSVRSEEDGIAIEKDGRGNQMKKLVDQIRMRSLMVDLLLFHNTVHYNKIYDCFVSHNRWFYPETVLSPFYLSEKTKEFRFLFLLSFIFLKKQVLCGGVILIC